MKVRPREAVGQAAARAFLARHHSVRVARLGELVYPLDHPALVAEAPEGQPLGPEETRPDGEGDPPRGEDAMPGIPTEGEPPSGG